MEPPAGRHISAQTVGTVIFVMVVGAVFQTVFGLGQPMSTAFQDLLTKLGQQAAPFIPDGLSGRFFWMASGRA
jgi:Fe2+ transport system protein B